MEILVFYSVGFLDSLRTGLGLIGAIGLVLAFCLFVSIMCKRYEDFPELQAKVKTTATRLAIGSAILVLICFLIPVRPANPHCLVVPGEEMNVIGLERLTPEQIQMLKKSLMEK